MNIMRMTFVLTIIAVLAVSSGAFATESSSMNSNNTIESVGLDSGAAFDSVPSTGIADETEAAGEGLGEFDYGDESGDDSLIMSPGEDLEENTLGDPSSGE